MSFTMAYRRYTLSVSWPTIFMATVRATPARSESSLRGTQG
jgi:hypothetical protein